MVVLTFLDSGGGIEEPARIFDSFYSTKPKGTGLGLAIVKGIVERSGGTIIVRNHVKGGAEFQLKWPEQSKSVIVCDEALA